MRSFAGFAAAILSIAVSASASARDVKIGDVTFSVGPPPGYCEVDQAQKADVGWLTSVTNLLNASNVTLIAAFPDCKELEAMRATNEFITTKILFTANTSTLGKASAQAVVATCKELKESGEKLTAEGKAKVEENVKKYSPNSLDQNQFLGVLEDNSPQVCYTGQYLKVTTSKGKESRMLDIFATSLVRNNIIFLYSFFPYVDGNSAKTGLTDIKVIYSNFVAANSR
jgi:hypothetical protein